MKNKSLHRNLSSILCLAILAGLASCSAAPTPTLPAATATRAPTITATSTSTPLPSNTPAVIQPVESNPMAISPQNAAAGLRLLAEYGQGTVFDVEYSPDGKYLAVATNIGITLYDAVTYEQVRFISSRNGVLGISFSPDGMALAALIDGKVSIWNVASGQKMREMEGGTQNHFSEVDYGSGDMITGIGISGRDGYTPTVFAWKISTGEQILANEADRFLTVLAGISPDGENILIPEYDHVYLYNPETGESSQEWDGAFDAIFNADGTKLITSNSNNYSDNEGVFLNDLETGNSTRILKNTDCYYLSGNGNSAICYGGMDVIVFSPDTGEAQQTIAFTNQVNDAAIQADGRFIAAASAGSIQIIDTNTRERVHEIPFTIINDLTVGQITLDNKTLDVAAYTDAGGVITILDLQTGEPLRTIDSHEDNINGLVFSPDRHTLASLSAYSTLNLWNLDNSTLTREYVITDYRIEMPMVFSPDGLEITLTDWDQMQLIELNLQSGKIQNFDHIGYSPDFSRMQNFFFYKSGHLSIWSLALEGFEIFDTALQESTEYLLPMIHEISTIEDPETFAISQDDRYMAYGMLGGNIATWDIDSQTLLQNFPAHTVKYGDGWSGSIWALRFSPQNDLLASIGYDHFVRLWNIHTGIQLISFPDQNDALFTPDGRYLVLFKPGAIQVWGIRAGE